MKLSLVLVLSVCALAMAAPTKVYYNLDEAPQLFETFIKDYQKEYKDDADKQVHYEAFKNNLSKINQQNEQSKSATFGINKFADYTDEDRKGMFGFGARKQ